MPPRIVLIAGLAAGCGGASAPTVPPAPGGEECVLRSGEGPPTGGIVAAALGADTALVSPARARTPLGLSCTGRPVARIASSWTTDSSRTAWTLVLSSAAELATDWRERPEAGAALRSAGVMAVLPLDDRRLVVTFRTAQNTVPAVFAHAALAAPAGVGHSTGVRDSVAFRSPPGPTTDLRDVLDGGASVVVTADPAVLDYAATRTDLRHHPLPWNRTYVLVSPRGAPPLVDSPMTDTIGFREGLARDAVRVAARGAQPPYWWDSAPGCARAAPLDAVVAAGVVYPRGDPVARSLAERVVAMAAPGATARAVPDAELGAAMAQGGWSGYVVPLPRRTLQPCRDLAAWPEGATALPLIDTRPTAVLKAGTPPLLVDYDGGLLPQPRQ